MPSIVLVALILLSTMIFDSLYPVYAQEISQTQAKQRALNFLGTNIKLDFSGLSSFESNLGKGRKCYRFVGPDDEGLTIDIDIDSGLICNFHWSKLAISSQEVKLNLKEASKSAEAFLIKLNLLPDNNLIKAEEQLINHGGGGKIYHFRWIKQINDVIHPFWLKTKVSASTGRTVDFSLIEHEVALKSLIPKLSQTEMLKSIEPLIRFTPGWKLVESNLTIGGIGKEQNLYWELASKTNI